MNCERCGKTDKETDIGDFHGELVCYPCAKTDRDLVRWFNEAQKKLGNIGRLRYTKPRET